MSSGERPIGAARGKQLDTEALCQPPPPPGGYLPWRGRYVQRESATRSPQMAQSAEDITATHYRQVTHW